MKKTLRYGISNEAIRNVTGVEKKLLREQIMQWFGHVERMDDERVPVKAKQLVIESSKKKGQPKKK